MKAKVTGVSAWQGTPTGGTLDIRVPRYADSHGNATVSHYTGVLKAGADGKLRWMDAEDPTRELWIVVQGPDDPAGPRATFYEVLDYGDKTVRTEFSRKLISSDLNGLIFDYAAGDQPLVPAGFGDAPLTMKAAEQLLDEGNQLVAEQRQALADTAQATTRANDATTRANDAADVIGAAGLIYLGTDAEGFITLDTIDPRATVATENTDWAVIGGGTIRQPTTILTTGGA